MLSARFRQPEQFLPRLQALVWDFAAALPSSLDESPPAWFVAVPRLGDGPSRSYTRVACEERSSAIDASSVQVVYRFTPFSDASRSRPPRAPCPNCGSPWKSGRSDEDRSLPSPCRPRSHPLSHRSEDGFLGTALRFPQATVCRDGRELIRRESSWR